MKKRIPFLLVHILIFLQSSAIAMDPEVPKTPQIHMIIPPEYKNDMDAMQVLAAFYPQIAQENPIIRSKEEFETAKVYLGLTKKYNHLLFTGSMYGPPENGMKDMLIQNSGYVLNGLQSYIKILQEETCLTFRSTADDQLLENEMYDVLFKTAQNHLMLLMKSVVTSNVRNDLQTVNTHVQAIKAIKEKLSPHAEYRKKLQEAIRDVEELVPEVCFLFNPQQQAKPLPFSKQNNRRIANQKTVNRYQKF